MQKRPGPFHFPPGKRVDGSGPASRPRRLLALLFTVVEVLAILVVLWQLRADGLARVALAVTLAGALVAVYDSWRG